MDDDVKERVREACDLAALVGETVQLQQRGRDLWGCCPFHQEKSPSFHVRPDIGRWKCFSCGKGGDCFSFVMERDHVDFYDALVYLAERSGIELPERERRAKAAPGGVQKARLYEAMGAAADFYHDQLTRSRSDGAAQARSYLGGRSFGSAVSQRWNLGYAPGRGQLAKHLSSKGFTAAEMVAANLATRSSSGQLRDRFFDRVMFPICDERGRTVALGGRLISYSKDGGQAKYLNSSETPIFHKGSTLFALDRAKASITALSEAVVMEGYTDVIASHEAGLTNCVAPLGTAFRGKHVKMLSRFLAPSGGGPSRGRIVFMFDGDDAGIRAAERAFQFVSLTTAGMYCVVLPDGKDPAEYLADGDPDALRSLIADAQPLARFVIDRHLDRFDIATPEQRAIALADVAAAMGPLKGTPLAAGYIEYVAGRLGADETTVAGMLAQVRWTPPREDDPDEQPAPLGGSAASQQSLELREPAFEVVADPSVPLLPEDARMIGVERRVLNAMAEAGDVARGFADRFAGIEWADPRHEAIAWAILATPDGSTPLDAIAAAESVCPDAAAILADGMDRVDAGVPTAATFEILLDDLEMRTIKRRIDRGRAELRAGGAGDPAAYDELFRSLSALQMRLRELESKLRSVV